MNTFQDLLPLILKAALLVPAVSIALYLAFHEVWAPLRDLHEKYERFAEVPKKSKKDHIQFWLFGRLPETSARRWHADQDAA